MTVQRVGSIAGWTPRQAQKPQTGYTGAQGAGTAGVTRSSSGIWNVGWMLWLAGSVDALTPILDENCSPKPASQAFLSWADTTQHLQVAPWYLWGEQS